MTILWSSTASASRMVTSSQVVFLLDQNSTFISALRIISPSKAAAKATGMGSSLTLMWMPRRARDRFEVSSWFPSYSSAPGTWRSPISWSTMTGKPRAMAPAPAETTTSLRGPKVLT